MTSEALIYIVVALKAEAQILIEHYQLKLEKAKTAFPIYCSDSICLIISGVGKIAAASAVGYLQAYGGNRKHIAWLNIGIAGHNSLELGSLVYGNQLMEHHSKHPAYPQLSFKVQTSGMSILTVDYPLETFQKNYVHEMEAFGFFSAANKFSTAELIHCLKIISDNKDNSIAQIKKSKIKQMFLQNLSEIKQWIKHLQALAQQQQNREKQPKEYQQFLQQWHFTQSQAQQLKKLLRQWDLLVPKESALKSIKNSNTTRQTLKILEEKLRQTSLTVEPF